MGYFIAGFLLGLAAGWFCLGRPDPGRGFARFFQREVDLSSYLEQMDQTGRLIDCLEKRCHRLERKLVSAGEKGSREDALSGCTGAGRKREQALALWEEGRELSEIIRRTGFSRGEIELILSLQEHH